jgi:hypothetical protein
MIDPIAMRRRSCEYIEVVTRTSPLVLVALAIAGCNAITGAAALVTDDGDSLPVPDRGDASPPAPSDASPPPPSDDAAPPDAAAGDATDARTKALLRVFATSTLHSGALGGLAGADQICAKSAAAAGIDGRFVAWLSASGAGGAVDAIDRLVVDGEWHLVSINGPRVAASKAALASGAIEHAIDRDENNALLPAQEDRVWTGTAPNGRLQRYDCAAWTTSGAVPGLVGEGGQRGAGWTALVPEACAQANRLYCFEQ